MFVFAVILEEATGSLVGARPRNSGRGCLAITGDCSGSVFRRFGRLATVRRVVKASIGSHANSKLCEPYETSHATLK